MLSIPADAALCDELIERCYEQGWTDGLPVVAAALRAMEHVDYRARSTQ